MSASPERRDPPRRGWHTLGDTPKDPVISQAVIVEGSRQLWISGQTARPEAGAPMPTSPDEQAAIAFDRVGALLATANATWADVAFLRFFATTRDAFEAVRAARWRYLGDARPAATGVIVTELAHPELLVEIEALAILPAGTTDPA